MMTADHPQLTPGTVESIANQEYPENVWLQVVYIRNIAEGRYKVALSDSRHFIQGMCMKPISTLIDDKTIELYSIIKVVKHQINVSKSQPFIVVGGVEVDSIKKCDSRINDPKNIDSAKKKEATAVGNGSEPFQSNVNNAPKVTMHDAQLSSSTLANKDGAGNAAANGDDNIQLIANLSPYHNRWTIRARITNKSDIKRFTNAKGDGQLFNCTLVDHSGEIRMTAFGDCVEKFFDLALEGQVFEISNAQVKIARKQFGVNNQYEIHLETGSELKLVQETGPNKLPTTLYKFEKISNIAGMEKDEICDTIGILTETGPISQITTRAGTQLSKRDLHLVDDSNTSVKVTIWGSVAENFNSELRSPVIAVKAARVNDYNGKSLSCSAISTLATNPDISEAHKLRGWYDEQGGASTIITSLTSTSSQASGMKDDRKTISQIKEEFLGTGDKPDFFSLVCTVSYIKSDGTVSYQACPTEGCNKKVIEEGANQYRCEKCQRVFDRCDHRYILNLQLSDNTDQAWATAFNETGQSLLGKSAEEMFYLRQDDEDAYAAVFKAACFKPLLVKMKAKSEEYQGEQKMRLTVMSALPADEEQECANLIEHIEQLVSKNQQGGGQFDDNN